MTATTDRDTLAAQGLLPNPNGFAMQSRTGVFIDSPKIGALEVAVDHLTELCTHQGYDINALKDDLQLVDERYHATVAALRWLDDSYKFDDLTREVIAHVTRPSR